jgi:EAL domain-containing protein (putative c-di-GMP-specific phosphodiesterase class I)
MYAVKRARPHREVETPLDLVDLEVDLRRAIDDRRLDTWFQPQYDGASGRIAGFEALARWRHPSRGWIPPRVFIPVAEESGLIGELGSRVLRDAARFAERAAARLGPVAISVNVARTELLDPGYPARVAALLAARRHDWSLTLEITELDLEEGDDRIRAALLALRGMGVAIAIDDFGSGASSLRMLQDLPVTAVKMDESFLHRGGALREGMIAAIVALGLGLGLEVMAEGIETASQLETLRRLRCTRLQGFLLGAPGPAELAVDAAPSFDAVGLGGARPARD